MGINWSDEDNIDTGGRGMTGAISFAGLSALKQLNCSGNSITALDASGNTALETLECFNTSITALDLSNNVLLMICSVVMPILKNCMWKIIRHWKI